MSALIWVCMLLLPVLGWIFRAVRAADRLVGRPDQAPQLPPWHEFLNPAAAYDQAIIDDLEKQFGEGR